MCLTVLFYCRGSALFLAVLLVALPPVFTASSRWWGGAAFPFPAVFRLTWGWVIGGCWCVSREVGAPKPRFFWGCCFPVCGRIPTLVLCWVPLSGRLRLGPIFLGCPTLLVFAFFRVVHHGAFVVFESAAIPFPTVAARVVAAGGFVALVPRAFWFPLRGDWGPRRPETVVDSWDDLVQRAFGRCRQCLGPVGAQRKLHV